eukprot:3898298-Alexandrium_andersonii.AAC.1
MERFLAPLFLPRLISTRAFGPAQFAYTPGRGARDAILHCVLCWLAAFASGHRVALYRADVSGAFDRVCSRLLEAKIVAAGVHPRLVRVLQSWLRPRTASVVVNGQVSRGISMSNMVYQGTVFGAPLWNLFFSDARKAIVSAGFTESIYADDLNAFTILDLLCDDNTAFGMIRECQRLLHRWGCANRVAFDAGRG